MCQHGSTRLGTEAGDDVDYTFRQAGVHERLDDIDGGKWSVLCRLDHASVSANQCGKELPRGNRHGEVPRSDHSANAYRLADGHRKFVGKLRGDGLTEETASFAGHV